MPSQCCQCMARTVWCSTEKSIRAFSGLQYAEQSSSHRAVDKATSDCAPKKRARLSSPSAHQSHVASRSLEMHPGAAVSRMRGTNTAQRGLPQDHLRLWPCSPGMFESPYRRVAVLLNLSTSRKVWEWEGIDGDSSDEDNVAGSNTAAPLFELSSQCGDAV